MFYLTLAWMFIYSIFKLFLLEKSKSMHDWLEMCTTEKQSIYHRKLKPLKFLKNWYKCLIKTLQFSEQSCKVLNFNMFKLVTRNSFFINSSFQNLSLQNYFLCYLFFLVIHSY